MTLAAHQPLPRNLDRCLDRPTLAGAASDVAKPSQKHQCQPATSIIDIWQCEVDLLAKTKPPIPVGQAVCFRLVMDQRSKQGVRRYRMVGRSHWRQVPALTGPVLPDGVQFP